MTWLWIALFSAFGAFVAEMIGQRLQRAEHVFFADQERVAREALRIKQRKWIRPLSRAGAAALLIGYAGLIGGFIVVIPGAIALSVFGDGMAPPWFGIGLILFAGAVLLLGPLGITAMILCRCGACAGWLFDNSQPSRKGFIGASRENWRFVAGKGHCPRCGAAA